MDIHKECDCMTSPYCLSPSIKYTPTPWENNTLTKTTTVVTDAEIWQSAEIEQSIENKKSRDSIETDLITEHKNQFSFDE